MLFTTPEFFIFLVVIILLMELIRHKLWQQIILLVASYFFYWWSGSIFVLLLAFVTLASWLCGLRLSKAATKKRKKLWLIIGTIIPLAVLAYFKYIDFGITQINNILALFNIASIPLLNVILPVGISFFTFQALSYVFDIYLGKLEHEPKFHRYALFIAFFPQLVAGPIVRAAEFLPQLKNKIHITAENLQIGVTLIIWGLFKKMVIADNVGGYVDTIYGNVGACTSVQIIGATILFGIQIYCDFSGYAHIAIGCARILGFRLPENFNLPYIARNFQDFWRRWHMTLSRFIRDYVYIPLGGNRKGLVRTYVNLIIAMVLCGFWHGAAWTFIIWGAYHGILQAIQRFIDRDTNIGKGTGLFSRFVNSNPGLFVKILVTQAFVFFGWMIFRANSLNDMLICAQKIIFFDFNVGTMGNVAIAGAAACVALIFLLMFNKKIADICKKVITFDYLGFISKLKISWWVLYIVVIGFAVLLLSPVETPEFIYFAF